MPGGNGGRTGSKGGAAKAPWTPPPRSARKRDLGGGAFDALAVLAAAALVGLGAANLSAVSGHSAAARQIALGAFGIALLVLLRRTRLSGSAVVGWVAYGLSVALLAGVTVVGVSANGARRWLAVGSLTFQPSELAELGLLMVMAHVLGSERGVTLRRYAAALVVAAVPIALTVLEPDLSTATLLAALAIAMLVLGRVPLRFLLPLFGAAALAAPLAVALLRPYQLARLHGFSTGSGGAGASAYSTLQAHIALASGGVLGQSRSPIHQLLAEYLPGRTNDLALASLTEQWGLVAAAGALAAAGILVWRLAIAARLPRSRPAGLVAGGLAVLIGLEAVVSVGGNLSLLPLAGVPFPLLSLGGTALVIHLAATGLALGGRRHALRRRLWTPPGWLAPKPRWVRAGALSTSAMLGVFGFYGWNLQKHQGPSLEATGRTEMTRCVRLPAARGVVTDRHGAVLAATDTQENVEAVPALLLSDPAGLRRLASVVGVPVASLRATLAATRHDLAAEVAAVTPAVAAQVSALHVPAVMIVPSPRRVYPLGPALGPLLGYVGIATPADDRLWANLPLGEIVGRSGIEREYDPILRGVDGEQCVFVDPAGTPVALGATRPPTPGSTLVLSIDAGLQAQVTADLAAGLAASRGDLGAVVAMDPRNGQVLAMASLPAYDDNAFNPPVGAGTLNGLARQPGAPMLEHATQSVAPPGSTFKLVVGSADVVYGAIPPPEVIPTGASFDLGGHTFNNWADLGPMNLTQSIAFSNDVYFYKLALALGPGPIDTVGSELGVGAPTGIDLPGESGGYLGTPASVHKSGGTWYAGSTVILGIGQGYLDVTPVQDARWTAAVATGSIVQPRVGLAVDTGNGSPAPLPAPAPQRLTFADRLGPVQAGMVGAVQGGTAAQLSNLPAPAAAKTGSAQDPASPGGAIDSWLSAVAPFPNPSVVVTSLVRGGGEGATTSGPVVDQALQYFLAHQAQILPALPGA